MDPAAVDSGLPDHFPQRIVCLTEEPTEVLYALGEEHRIVGISGFTVRPPRARKEKPKVSAFTSATGGVGSCWMAPIGPTNSLRSSRAKRGTWPSG